MMTNEDCVSLSALAVPGEDEQMESPAVGDKVQYTTEGTITRVEGDQAYVKREAVNGEPVKDVAPQEPAMPAEESDMNDLRSMAEKEPERY